MGWGAEAVPTREQIYLITRLGTLDARPPEQAWGQCRVQLKITMDLKHFSHLLIFFSIFDVLGLLASCGFFSNCSDYGLVSSC